MNALTAFLNFYDDLGVLPTEHQLTLTLSVRSVYPNHGCSQVVRDFYRDLQERGFVTAPGPHSGHRHLTEAGHQWIKETRYVSEIQPTRCDVPLGGDG